MMPFVYLYLQRRSIVALRYVVMEARVRRGQAATVAHVCLGSAVLRVKVEVCFENKNALMQCDWVDGRRV